MKIEINYDLFQKIKEAKKGFSLIKCAKPVLSHTTIFVTIDSIISLLAALDNQPILYDISYYLILSSLCYGMPEMILSKITQPKSINELKKLSITLNRINVNTDYELLLESYKYKTEYKVKFDESFIPYLKQDKYINVPVYVNGEEKEVSLVQEHIIGSEKYYLSYGSPKKVLKPAFDSI